MPWWLFIFIRIFIYSLLKILNLPHLVSAPLSMSSEYFSVRPFFFHALLLHFMLSPSTHAHFHGGILLHSSTLALRLASTVPVVNVQDSFTLESTIYFIPFQLSTRLSDMGAARHSPRYSRAILMVEVEIDVKVKLVFILSRFSFHFYTRVKELRCYILHSFKRN